MNIFNNKKLIIFDLDGTLVDSVDVFNEMDRRLIIRGGKIPPTNIHHFRDSFLKTVNKHSNPYTMYSKYLKDYFDLPFSYDEIVLLKDEYNVQLARELVTLKKDADILLKLLKEKGYLIALATVTSLLNYNIYCNENQNITSKCKFNKIFDFVITFEDISQKKPNPEIFFKVLEHFGLPSDEILIFEDSISGLEAARRANIDTVLVYDKYSYQEKEMKKFEPVFFAKEYKDLIALI